MSFIDAHREVYGVEPICRVLPIAPSTYHAHIARKIESAGRSARSRRDDALGPEVRRVFEENFRVYGVCKVWRQLWREGFDIAPCTVARLMRAMGLGGVIRSKPVRTTVSDKAAPYPLDRVNRQFRAPAPDMQWMGSRPSCAQRGSADLSRPCEVRRPAVARGGFRWACGAT